MSTQPYTFPASYGTFFCVQGIPSNFTWQHLKDALRNVLQSEPGWVDIIPHSPENGGPIARFSVKSQSDALAAFDALTNRTLAGRYLLVHVFNDRLPSPVCVWCNCAVHHPGTNLHYTPYAPLDAGTFNRVLALPPPAESARRSWSSATATPATAYYGSQAAAQTQSAYGYGYPQAASTSSYGYGTHAQSVTHGAPVAPGYTAGPVYQNSVNVGGGYVSVEKRGVFLKDLSYETTKEELENLLSTVAKPVSLDFPSDPRTKKSRGYATAQFASAYEADQVVQKLDGVKLRKRKIKVRLDKEAQAIEE